MRTASDFITELASRGRHHFTTEEAAAVLKSSLPATRASLRRLKARREIAEPYRGFHLIVPPEYRGLGCLPPEQFVSQLMEHLGELYYVALLSAAELHGAAHHRPQRFQVMLAKNRRDIHCGEVIVEFVARHDLAGMPTVEKNTPRGRLRIASPELTALELVGYAGHCGGLDNVASVLVELAEALDVDQLEAVAKLCPLAWVQRLGYLLELTENAQLAEKLVSLVQARGASTAPLIRAKSISGAFRSERWNLAINADVEPDL